MEIRNPVEPVNELIGHVGKRLNQSDTGVGNIVIGPVWISQLHEALGLVNYILKTSII